MVAAPEGETPAEKELTIGEKPLPADAEPTTIGRIEGSAELPARRGVDAPEAMDAPVATVAKPE